MKLSKLLIIFLIPHTIFISGCLNVAPEEGFESGGSSEPGQDPNETLLPETPAPPVEDGDGGQTSENPPDEPRQDSPPEIPPSEDTSLRRPLNINDFSERDVEILMDYDGNSSVQLGRMLFAFPGRYVYVSENVREIRVSASAVEAALHKGYGYGVAPADPVSGSFGALVLQMYKDESGQWQMESNTVSGTVLSNGFNLPFNMLAKTQTEGAMASAFQSGIVDIYGIKIPLKAFCGVSVDLSLYPIFSSSNPCVEVPGIPYEISTGAVLLSTKANVVTDGVLIPPFPPVFLDLNMQIFEKSGSSSLAAPPLLKLSVEGSGKSFNVSNEFDFGSIKTPANLQSAIIKIANTGDLAAEVFMDDINDFFSEMASSEGAREFYFSEYGTCYVNIFTPLRYGQVATLAPGASCTMAFNFIPTTEGAFWREFSLKYLANNEVQTLSVKFKAQVLAAPAVSSTIDLEGLTASVPKKGTSSSAPMPTYDIQVTNVGYGWIKLPSSGIVDSNTTYFQFQYSGTCYEMAARGEPLYPGESCTLRFGTRWTTAGSKTVKLKVFYNDASVGSGILIGLEKTFYVTVTN